MELFEALATPGAGAAEIIDTNGSSLQPCIWFNTPPRYWWLHTTSLIVLDQMCGANVMQSFYISKAQTQPQPVECKSARQWVLSIVSSNQVHIQAKTQHKMYSKSNVFSSLFSKILETRDIWFFANKRSRRSASRSIQAWPESYFLHF